MPVVAGRTPAATTCRRKRCIPLGAAQAVEMILPFLQSSAAAVSWAGCRGPEPRQGSWCRASALPHSRETPWTSRCPRRASPGLGCTRGVPIASPDLSFPVIRRAQDSEHWLAAQTQGTHPGAAWGRGFPAWPPLFSQADAPAAGSPLCASSAPSTDVPKALAFAHSRVRPASVMLGWREVLAVRSGA